MKAGTRVVWHKKKAMGTVKQAGQKACRDVAMAVLEDAKGLVPHDLGDLEGSGDLTDEEGGKIGCMVFFDKPYAAMQHEDTSLNHRGGRSAKYLETPVKQRGRELKEQARLEVLGALKRGGM